MVTIHLSAERYRMALAAGRFDEGKDADYIPIPFENEPNVKIGDDVEVVVEGLEPQIGTVVNIEKPSRKLSPEELRNRRASLEEVSQMFQHEFGVHPDLFPKDQFDEECLEAQWYLFVKHKGKKV
jgi:hypothetical protein